MSSLSRTRRAIEAREWRATKREKRRFNMLLTDFTKVKFGNVYREGKDFFESLNGKYPTKHDLTKTKEYKRWKSNIINDTENEKEPESEAAEQVRELSDNESDDEANEADNEAGNEADVEADNKAGNGADNEAELPSDILQIAASDLIPGSPEIELNDRIDQIIRELQQDDDLREFLNAERNGDLVHPRYEDEDEGIGLNVDTELQAIIEPFDFELEVEGGDW